MPAPTYVTRPNIRRVLIPDALKTATLCLVFYAAIQLNLKLFYRYRLLSVRPPMSISLAIAGVLLLLCVIEALNVYRKYTVAVYDFYPDRIELYGRHPETLQLAMVTGVQLRRNALDSLFRTGTIVFQPDFRIEHVESPEQVLAYVQGLAAQARGAYAQQYQRFQAYRQQ